MTFIEAIILGLIQGATEFLPISSSGHLILVPALLKMPEPALSFVATVHQGTLLAVLIYFRRDLWQIAQGVWHGLIHKRPFATPESRLGWYIVFGSIPAAAAGLLLESFFDRVFGTPVIAAFLLAGTAVLLLIGEKQFSGQKQINQMGWIDALIIGLFQALALFPGISRSGSTITAGLWRGLDRTAAARFSFLLGIPAILGAGLLSAIDLAQATDLAAQLPILIGGFVSAAVVGYVSIHFLLQWLRQHKLTIFIIYCLAFSLVALLILLLS